MNIEELRARWTRALKRTVEANASDAPASHPTFGTVRQLNPLRVSLDTAPTVWLGYAPPCVNTYPSYVGQRVWVETHGRQVVIIGVLVTAGPSGVSPDIGMGYIWTPNATIPGNCIEANGIAQLIADYPALYAVYGQFYAGGNGSTTFGIPNYTGRTIVGKKTGTFSTVGGVGGTESETLTVAQMPAHDGHISGYSGTLAAYLAAPGGLTAYADTGHGWKQYRGNEIYPYHFEVGGGGSHNNLPPYAVARWVIRAK